MWLTWTLLDLQGIFAHNKSEMHGNRHILTERQDIKDIKHKAESCCRLFLTKLITKKTQLVANLLGAGTSVAPSMLYMPQELYYRACKRET